MSNRFLYRTDLFLRISTILGLVLMAACSTSKSPTPTQATSPKVSSQTVVPTAAARPGTTLPKPSDTPSNATPDVNAGNVTITFADLNFANTTDYQSLADAFHKLNPTITVIVIPVDHTVQINWGADYAKQADVVSLAGENPAELGGFLSLQPLLDASTDFNQKDFWPGSFVSCEDDQGVPYGVPMILEPKGIYYDPQLFDAAKVPYPQPGWTWDQFRQTINLVGATANDTITYGLVDGPVYDILGQLIDQQILANDGKLDSKGLADSLAWYAQLAKDQKLYPVQPANSNGYLTSAGAASVIEGYTGDKAAMWVDTPGSAITLPQGKRSVYLPFPVDPQDDHTTPIWAPCAAISSGTHNPQAAWAWLDFLSKHDLTGSVGPEDLQHFGGYYLPGRQSLTPTSMYWISLSDTQRSAVQYALEHAYYYPASLMSISMVSWNAMLAIAKAIKDGTDLVSPLDAVAAAASLAAQATPTSTAGPVVLNTAPVPTSLPEGVTAINFNENSIMSMAYTYNGPEIKALVDAFESRHPDIAVILTGDVSTPADGDTMHALAQSNDCFEAQSPGLTNSLSSSDLLDLTPFLDADPEMKADFNPAFLLPYQKEGKFYGLPADVFLQYIAYNADLLNKLGIQLPQAGWTVDDLVSIAGRAADPGAAVPIIGFGNGGQLFYTLGVPWFDASVKPPKATFNTPEMASGLTWLQQLYQKGTFAGIYNSKFTDYLKAITQGQVALWITDGQTNYNTDPWDNAKHPIYDQNLSFTVGYAPLPLLKSGAAMSIPQGGTGYYISSQASQAKVSACWAWIQYLSGMPSIFGGYTPRQSVLSQEDVGQDPARLAVVQAAIQEYNNDGYAGYNDPQLWAYNDILGYAILTVASGGSVTAALAKAQSDADAYLACIYAEGFDRAE